MASRAFSRSLYDEACVRAGVQAFGSVATLTVEDLGHAVQVTVTEAHPSYGDERIADELANYVLQVGARARAAV
jgi:hypothetical protein